MTPVRAGVFLFLLMIPLVMSGQEAGPARLPLAITDKEAVDAWRQAIWDGPLDARLPSDTEFLLSLTDAELLGRFRFKQRCALCHAAQTNLSTVTWGPLLTQRHVAGREAIVRERILEGSARMPAFKARRGDHRRHHRLSPEGATAAVRRDAGRVLRTSQTRTRRQHESTKQRVDTPCERRARESSPLSSR